MHGGRICGDCILLVGWGRGRISLGLRGAQLIAGPRGWGAEDKRHIGALGRSWKRGAKAQSGAASGGAANPGENTQEPLPLSPVGTVPAR